MAATGGRERKGGDFSWRRPEGREAPGRSGTGRRGRAGGGRRIGRAVCLLMAGGGHMRKSLLSPGFEERFCGLQRCNWSKKKLIWLMETKQTASVKSGMDGIN